MKSQFSIDESAGRGARAGDPGCCVCNENRPSPKPRSGRRPAPATSAGAVSNSSSTPASLTARSRHGAQKPLRSTTCGTVSQQRPAMPDECSPGARAEGRLKKVGSRSPFQTRSTRFVACSPSIRGELTRSQQRWGWRSVRLARWGRRWSLTRVLRWWRCLPRRRYR